jgi:hypothetical protein
MMTAAVDYYSIVGAHWKAGATTNFPVEQYDSCDSNGLDNVAIIVLMS